MGEIGEFSDGSCRRRRTKRSRGWISTLLVSGALLALAVLALYAPARNFDFVNLDDPFFVTGNPAVRGGLTAAGVRWSLGDLSESNWQPVTWWSHMLDVSLFGLDAGKHHLVSVALHALNAVLLLVLLHRLTGRLAPSLLAAALFALHPLRVESVAWVAERKDVLSASFWLLATLAYAGWCRGRSRAGYVALVALTALGMMSKAMLVTLPFTLLLLDVWPLGRAAGPRREAWGRLLLEKAPLFALSAVTAAVAVVAQRTGGSLATLADLSLAARLETAVVGYVWYVGKLLWPTGLAVLHLPPAEGWPPAQVLLCAAGLAGATALALAAARRRPYLAVGWLWYLVTLLPVSGIVQVGSQATADRYSYIPAIGLAVAAVWAAAGSFRRSARTAFAAALAGLVALGSLAAATAVQLRYWRDSEALFVRSLAVTPDNFMALNNLGQFYAARQRWDLAAEHYRRAIRAAPGEGYARVNLGISLEMLGRAGEAVPEFEAALRLLAAPAERAEAHRALARLLPRFGRAPEAQDHLREYHNLKNRGPAR